MNLKTEGKLHDAIVMACFGYYLGGKPLHTQLHNASHKHNGHVKKQLERIVALGPQGAERFIHTYLSEWEPYKEGLNTPRDINVA